MINYKYKSIDDSNNNNNNNYLLVQLVKCDNRTIKLYQHNELNTNASERIENGKQCSQSHTFLKKLAFSLLQTNSDI